MTLWTLILRSLRHHARAHAGVLLGAAVGSAVLGALECGDWSPLSAGDSSPSHSRARPFLDARLDERSVLRWRDSAGAARKGAALAYGGDQSPAESGDESPHSIT